MNRSLEVVVSDLPDVRNGSLPRLTANALWFDSISRDCCSQHPARFFLSGIADRTFPRLISSADDNV